MNAGTALTWFSRDLLPDGRQTVSIRPLQAEGPRIDLDVEQSCLFHAVLQHCAQDPAIPYGELLQAVLRAFAGTIGAAR